MSVERGLSVVGDCQCSYTDSRVLAEFETLIVNVPLHINIPVHTTVVISYMNIFRILETLTYLDVMLSSLGFFRNH